MNVGDVTADRRLYETVDGQVVEADDPRRARLVAAAGAVIPKEEAERLGLTDKDGILAYHGFKKSAIPKEDEPAAAEPVVERAAARQERQVRAAAEDPTRGKPDRKAGENEPTRMYTSVATEKTAQK